MDLSINESGWTISENDSSVDLNGIKLHDDTESIPHVKEFFDYDIQSNKSTCKLENVKLNCLEDTLAIFGSIFMLSTLQKQMPRK